jgi:hypothetical protein
MMNRAELHRWLLSPSVKGYQAILWCLLAVAIPTAFRISVDELVTGIAVTPFVPSVLLSAIFLGARYASGVTIASAAVADAFFIGPPLELFEGPSDLIGLGIFFLASAMIIAFVQLVRNLLADTRQSERTPWSKGNVVFSLEEGQAWAGWHGERTRVRLGPQEEVAEMMEDFLAQVELGKYLNSKVRSAAPQL